MNEEFSLKNEIILDYNDYEDIKRPNKNKKKKLCPWCNNEMKPNIFSNGMVYCNVCHKKLPWQIFKTNDKPVKEEKNDF